MSARERLIDWIGELDSGAGVVGTFERGGLAGPVELDLDGKRLVVQTISLMLREEELGGDEVDPQLRKLWECLRDELTVEG